EIPIWLRAWFGAVYGRIEGTGKCGGVAGVEVFFESPERRTAGETQIKGEPGNLFAAYIRAGALPQHEESGGGIQVVTGNQTFRLVQHPIDDFSSFRKPRTDHHKVCVSDVLAVQICQLFQGTVPGDADSSRTPILCMRRRRGTARLEKEN